MPSCTHLPVAALPEGPARCSSGPSGESTCTSTDVVPPLVHDNVVVQMGNRSASGYIRLVTDHHKAEDLHSSVRLFATRSRRSPAWNRIRRLEKHNKPRR